MDPNPLTKSGILRLAVWGTGLVLAILLGTVSAQGFDQEEAERELVTLTNVDRTSNGVSALLPDDRVMEVARFRSEDMATRNYFAHEIPPEGYYFDVLLDQRDIPYLKAGENLARNNYPDEQSVRVAESDWLNSPSHRRNILDPDFTHLGTGAALAADQFKIYTVLFIESPGFPALQPTPPPLTATPPPTATSQPPATPTATITATATATSTPPPGERITQPPPIRTGLLRQIINRILSLFLNLW